jgi:predicted Fe-Mo cluster-binding NifX family protein
MIVAVTSQGPDANSPVDPRFGRAKYFLVVDTDSGQCVAHDNATNLNAVQGAGLQAARAVVELGAQAVVTGNVGPKALGALRAAGVQVYPGASGTVMEAVAEYKSGRLQAAVKANVEGHWM